MRIGVVGVGSLGFHHVRILRDLPGAELVGFYEIRPERAAAVAQELGVRPFSSLEELVGACQALTIAVPTKAHHSVAKVALEHGCHLLIEKPIAAALDEADEIVELAERAGVVVQTGHVERFNRAVRGAWGLVANPRYLESDRLAPFTPRGADVAVVLDLMIHDIDLVLTLMGSDVDGISAIGVPVLTRSIDIANARLTFRSGAVANITASRVAREKMRKVRIFQESGYLSLDLATGRGEFFRLRRDLDLTLLASSPQPLEAFVERIELEAPEAEPLRLEFESFLAAVRGESPVTVSARAGRDALALALRIEAEIHRGLREAQAAGDSG